MLTNHQTLSAEEMTQLVSECRHIAQDQERYSKFKEERDELLRFWLPKESMN